MEIFIVYRKAAQILASKGVNVTPGACGEYLTVQEMAGFQMILCKVDADHIELIKAKARTPYWTA